MAVETGRSQSKRRKQRRSRLGKLGHAIPYAVGGVVLVAYFVWMCIEMSSEAPDGGAVPLAIFGGVLLGVLAAAASVLVTRRGR